MLKILKHALRGGVVTNDFPATVSEPPDGFRGRPVIDFERCTACDLCSDACPTAAISLSDEPGGLPSPGSPDEEARTRTVTLDYGHCIFCGACEAACPETVNLTKEFQLAAGTRGELRTGARYTAGATGEFRFQEILGRGAAGSQASYEELGKELRAKIAAVLGRSLHIREVDAGSCNGCEIEITALNNPVYDIERFGVHIVASPRHADMLLVTGPVTRNMELALKRTYEAAPDPRLVVAVGACAIGGGMFGKSYASCGGADGVVPVDVFIPGCPPRPEAILHGILSAINRLTTKNFRETPLPPHGASVSTPTGGRET